MCMPSCMSYAFEKGLASSATSAYQAAGAATSSKFWIGPCQFLTNCCQICPMRLQQCTAMQVPGDCEWVPAQYGELPPFPAELRPGFNRARHGHLATTQVTRSILILRPGLKQRTCPVIRTPESYEAGLSYMVTPRFCITVTRSSAVTTFGSKDQNDEQTQ